MKFILPEYVKNTLFSIKNAGFEAFCVGGCVRDMLIGKVPFDFDITTSASPEEIMNIFPKCAATGIKHGTVTVIDGKNTLEVTTYRTDGNYADSRHPENVTFVKSLREDLARRDFTVNAIAYNESDGIKDYYGGIDDINNKILKTVGDAEKRFSEDALRILRLFRFASQLNFSIEENTLTSAIKLKDTVSKISRERVFAELKKLLLSDYPENSSYYINNGGLDFLGISRIENLQSLKQTSKELKIRFYVFCKLANADGLSICNELKADNELKHFISAMNKLDNMPLFTKADIKKALSLTSPYCVYSMLKLKNISTEIIDEIIAQNEPYTLSQLAITGNDIKALGVDGKDIGEVLKQLLLFIIENPNYNKREILIKKAESIVTK